MNENMDFDSDKTIIDSAPGGNATQMVMDNPDATQYAANVECPVCHTPNPLSETYCTDCGFMLNSAPVAIDDMPQAASYGKLVATDGTIEFSLNDGENSVGRENADVLLSHNTVSRKHGRVFVESGVVYVEDLNSTNGTYVSGAKIEQGVKTELKDGAEVTFGSVTLRYQAPEVVPQEAEATIMTSEPEIAVTEINMPPDETQEQVAEGEEPVENVTEETVSGTAGILSAKDGSQTFTLADGLNTIGRRDGANTIVIADPYCSGRHADLSVQDGIFILTDLE
ncbi:MAG: FHA domain-containing protein, partial [Armatimonadetes bacterium]|nr:FHA domain-containing protein [Armatimonadota bacterium]